MSVVPDPEGGFPGTRELKAQVTDAWEEAQEVHRQEHLNFSISES
jgi:hypothetical protein